MKIKEIKTLKRVEFSRGFLEENELKDFYVLHINAIPESYHYLNWSKGDLKDLMESIEEVLKREL